MVNIEERKINIEEGAKKKFDIIGNFIGCKPKIINGSIISIEKTNISYI